jgi:hypothetical protein
MRTYILINTDSPKDPVLGVYDSDLLAQKRKLYFESVYLQEELLILEKEMEYIDRE